jgi:hypothetical protein
VPTSQYSYTTDLYDRNVRQVCLDLSLLFLSGGRIPDVEALKTFTKTNDHGKPA